ncbi:alpha/beta fold hydrolase [Numidum massiliense]|uniref:alpha/beta fold hydrolase n=1 Tax=Numidum massiliense TaxID=1522315 RepID=UPI0006D5704D|nr:alpha/beta hydrolase [Numidum massiliense]
MLDIEEKMHTFSNTRMYVQCAGSAEQAVLLIHGFLGSTFSWRFLLPQLSPFCKVFAVDLPGFGRSDKSTKYPYTLAAYAKSLYDLLQAEGVKRVTLIAHSLGGQIALRLATIAPQLVKQLVLIAPSGYLPEATRLQKFIYALPFTHRFVPFMLKDERVHKELSSVIYRTDAIDIQSLYDGYVPPLKERSFHRALLKFARARESDLSPEALRSVRHRTLLIWGRHDRVVPLTVGQRLSQDLPNVQLEVVEEAGHLPMEEKPREVMRHVTNFLSLPVKKSRATEPDTTSTETVETGTTETEHPVSKGAVMDS